MRVLQFHYDRTFSVVRCDAMNRFSEEKWRRRPDLNRRWRFCRQGWIVYLVDSSCFLVGPTPPFSLVFGRYCSHVVPKLSRTPWLDAGDVGRVPPHINAGQHLISTRRP